MLVAAFMALVMALALLLEVIFDYGVAGLAVALALAAVASLAAWTKSDAVVLAVHRARPADPVELARLHNLAEGLCVTAGLPKPRLYVVDDDAPNAFAVGRDPRHAGLAVTTGVMDKLTRVELEGVLAHELSHVKSYDTRLSTLAVTLVGGPSLLSDVALGSSGRGDTGRRGGDPGRGDRRAGMVGAVLRALGTGLLVVAPLVGTTMKLALRGRRELSADMSAVALTRYPPGLISALEKLRDDPGVVQSASLATAHLWIESPVRRASTKGRGEWANRRFDPHLPLDQRITALRQL
ncbi:MAG: M48 family metallopeptidase [Acidimicrobiales bacterium]